MEWEEEVELEESFNDYTWKERLNLIYHILRGWDYMFRGDVWVSLEPPEYP